MLHLAFCLLYYSEVVSKRFGFLWNLKNARENIEKSANFFFVIVSLKHNKQRGDAHR